MKICFVCCLLCACLLLGGCAARQEEVIEIFPQPEQGLAVVKLPASDEDINGQWHGYWEIFACSGVWAEFEKQRWDCWAEIENKHILIWDEDISREEGLAVLDLEVDGEAYKVVSGRFMDVNQGFDTWRLSLESDDGGGLLCLRGHYEGSAHGRFSFAFYLQPDNED